MSSSKNAGSIKTSFSFPECYRPLEQAQFPFWGLFSCYSRCRRLVLLFSYSFSIKSTLNSTSVSFPQTSSLTPQHFLVLQTQFKLHQCAIVDIFLCYKSLSTSQFYTYLPIQIMKCLLFFWSMSFSISYLPKSYQNSRLHKTDTK